MNEEPDYHYYIRTLTRKGSFEVLDSEKRRWAFLDYQSWFSQRAGGEANGQELAILPQNIFHSKFDILLDGEDVGDLIFNWKSQMVIRLLDYQQQERQYLLRVRGVFKQRFILEDDIKNPILELKPKFNWAKMRYDFKVYLQETQYLQSPVEPMMAVCAYAVNLYLKRKSSSAAGSS